MPLVDIHHVSRIYRQGKVDVTALKDVSLGIEPGEFLALSGPSGSGKTTLLNLMGGLDSPQDGTVSVDGQDLTAMSQADLSDLRLHTIGFIFQAYNLIPVLTAQENVEYVMLLQGVPARERADKARAMLDEVGLGNMYSRRPAELSGGQQQRVAVARAIVSGPSLVLADEPTANLDSKTGKGLLEIMLEMNRRHDVTFIFSTHDDMVLSFARRIVSLKDGQVVDDVQQ